MKKSEIEGFDRFHIRAIMQRASKIGAYISAIAGVLDAVTGRAAAANGNGSLSGYSLTAYILTFCIIVVSILIIRLMVKYYSRRNYHAGLQTGKEVGREELLQEQVEEELADQEEDEEEPEAEEEEEEENEDIDYDMMVDDIDKYSESMSDEDSDQPIVQNINKFVTGYKFLKPPDVAVLTLTKRFDEYEVGIALPEAKKGASKISEFIPFESKTRKNIVEEFDGVSQLNNSMVGMPNMGGMGPIITSRLDGLGKRMSETFIPDGVMKNLQAIKDPIIIETNDGELLWEVLHDGADFIALKHPIGRVLKTKEEARVNEFERVERLRFLLVANPTGDLDSTEREAEYIESILKQKVAIDKIMGSDAKRDNILNAFSSGKYDVIHYAGHADSESEGEAALLAADGRLLSSEIKAALAGRPYVYLNACGSGKETMEETKDYTAVSDTEGLASAFILGGAVGFMGAMWRLPDKSAAEFSVKFYEGLIENLKVGEACRQARLSIKKQNPSDITWAAFLQYGDPVQRLKEKKKEKAEEEAESDEELDEDAEVEVIEEDELEKEDEPEEEEEEEEEELSEEEKLKQYQGWIVGGLKHMENKKYEDAITAFDSAIGLLPERYNAWHLTGNALRELRRYNEAIECYDKAIERDATIDEIWYDKSLALGAVGRFDEALDCNSIVETLKVGRVKEWLKKANELMLRGGVSDAVKIYNRIIKENEKYPLAWYLKGIAHAELGETEEALGAFDKSIINAKKFSQGFQKKSWLLFGLKRYDEALENINRALVYNPISEDSLLLKADILIATESYKNALKSIEQLLAQNKNNADALLRKADILRRYHKVKQSLETYEHIIKLNPENQEAWFWRSQLLNELGTDSEQELHCYRKLMEMDIDDPLIMMGVGSALEGMEGAYEDKLNWYEKMIQFNPNTPRAWYNKAVALESLGKKDEALEAFKQATELEPDNKNAHFRAALIHENNGEFENAAAHYQRVTELDKNDFEALLNLSNLQKKLGQEREALNGFSRLYKGEPENITVLLNLRDIYFGLGKYKNAMTLSNKLIKILPDEPDNIRFHVKLLYDFKNYPEVLKYSDKLVEQMPEDTELLVMRAEAFSNMNRMDDALACWNRIIMLESTGISEQAVEEFPDTGTRDPESGM